MSRSISRENPEKNIVLGRVSGVFGVQGWIKVHSYTSERANILKYKTWRLEKDGKISEYTLQSGKIHGKGMIAKLESIDDRDTAATLFQANIVISRNELPPLAEGEYYWEDLQGLTVFNVAGKKYGVIDHLFETGANDVIVVKGDKEILIPFVQGEYVKKIDLENNTMLVDWPEEF